MKIAVITIQKIGNIPYKAPIAEAVTANPTGILYTKIATNIAEINAKPPAICPGVRRIASK